MMRFFKRVIGSSKNEVNAEREVDVQPLVNPEDNSMQEAPLCTLSDEEQQNSTKASGVNEKQDINVTHNTHREQSSGKMKNAVVLLEATQRGILEALAPFKFGDITVSAIRLHTKYGETQVEGIAFEEHLTNDNFVNAIKGELQGNGIKYVDSFKIELVYNSADFGLFTLVENWLSIEPVTSQRCRRKKKALISVDEGFIWEDIVEIEPTTELCRIGRGKRPKLPSGISISNKVAFVCPTEVDDPKYEINRHVSRSIACIFYDEKSNEFKIERSKLMDNRGCVVKLIHIGRNSVNTIPLIYNIARSYTLQDGDRVTFNDKVAIEVRIVEED